MFNISEQVSINRTSSSESYIHGQSFPGENKDSEYNKYQSVCGHCVSITPKVDLQLTNLETNGIEQRKYLVKTIDDEITRTFMLPDRTSDKYTDRHFFFCNEFNDFGGEYCEKLDFKFAIKELENLNPEATKSGKIKSAILVGESCLTSIIPELSVHCDIVIMLDHDPDLLILQQKRIDFISTHHEVESENLFVESMKEIVDSCAKDTSEDFKENYYRHKKI